MQTTKRVSRRLTMLGLAAALGTAGFLAVGSVAGGATTSAASVSVHMTKLGPVLVNSRGHTLYLFRKDRNGRSSCTGPCSQFWPPLLVSGRPSAGPGVRASMLGTTRRSNGSLQVTYNRHPLYSFSLDQSAGQTNGEGNLAFGARWYAVSAAGSAVMKPSPNTTTTTPTYTYKYP